jgi:hypothetical protein
MSIATSKTEMHREERMNFLLFKNVEAITENVTWK